MKKIIHGVPLLTQKPNWCGYTCLAMVLQYWGYELSPENLFRIIFNSNQEDTSSNSQIGIGNLAAGALSLTTLKVRLYSMEIYEKLKKEIPKITPLDILRANLDKNIPCIVRLPGHYNVAIGYDETSYFFNEPSGGIIVQRDFRRFDMLWGTKSKYLSYDSRYLILAINR